MFKNRSNRYPVLILILIFSLIGCSSSDKNDETTSIIKPYLDSIILEENFPGMIGIVTDSTQILEQETAGVINSNSSIEMSEEHLIYIGSITKSMTATMIGKLVDEEVLNWNTKPVDVIDGLQNTIHKDYEEITLLDLLHHRAGVPSDEKIPILPELSGSLTEQRLQATRWLLQLAPAQARGTFSYSNAGYTLAAAMAESATSKTWQELMDSLLFDPIDINAFYGWPTEYGSNQPSGHQQNGQNFNPINLATDNILSFLRFLEPAGIISMTMEDFSKFVRLHLNAAQRNYQILSDETFNTLHQPVEDYACGLVVENRTTGKLIWHNGSDGFHYAIMHLLPEKNRSVTLWVNAGGDSLELNINNLMEEIIKNY